VANRKETCHHKVTCHQVVAKAVNKSQAQETCSVTTTHWVKGEQARFDTDIRQ